MLGVTERAMKTWLLGIALAATLPAQTLEGVVVDQVTGLPVVGVHVGMDPMGSANVRYRITDAAGRFRLDSPAAPVAAWHLSIGRSGYLQQTFSSKASPDQPVTNVRIELTPQAVISGTVEDEDGFPLQSDVFLLGYRLVDGRRQLKGIINAVTNDLGEFRLAGLVAGRYYLRVTPRSEAMYGVNRYAGEYYPAALQEAEAKPIEVRAGQKVTGVRMRLKPNRGFRISGRIVLPAGYNSAAPISLGVSRSDGYTTWFSHYTSVRPDGGMSFTLRNFAPGDYELRVQRGAPEIEPGTLYGRLPVHVDRSDLSGLDLRCRIAQPVDIPGRVIFAAGTRARAISAGLSGPASPSARVNDDGTFVLKGIMPGLYTPRVMEVPRTGGDRPVQVQSVRYAGREVPGRRIDLDAQDADATLEITVAEPSAELRVRAIADRAETASTAWIYVVSTSGGNAYSLILPPEQIHQFMLLPGEYRVFAARDSTYFQAVEDPDFLAAHEKDMPVVRFQAGQNPTVELRVISR
jgi:hypothetical protein